MLTWAHRSECVGGSKKNANIETIIKNFIGISNKKQERCKKALLKII